MEPKQLFDKKDGPSIKKDGPSAFIKPKSPTKNPSTLFPDKAITNQVTDPILAMNPLCAGLVAKDVNRVKTIVDSSNLEQTTFVLEYADGLRNTFADLVNKVISQSAGSPMMTVSTNITELLQKIQFMRSQVKLLTNPPAKHSWFSFSKSNIPTIPELVFLFQQEIAQVDQLVIQLTKAITFIISDVQTMDQMYKANKDQFQLLNLHIVAGKIIVQKYTNNIIPSRTRQAGDDIFKMQDLSYLKDCVQRFDRKVLELEKLAQSVILTGPQIRLHQSNSKDIAEQIKQLTLNVVPVWKHQFSTILTVLQSPSFHNISDLIESRSFQQLIPILQDIQNSHDKFESMLSKSPVV
jgi:uncharacterized protein YaaN involved in tellurite resistance